MSIRVAVFDDQELFLDSISSLISSSPGFELTGAYQECGDIPLKFTQALPDVVIMDIEMPPVNGIEAVKEIKKSFPTVMVMMQTSHDDDENVYRAICAGATGYLLKNDDPEKIISSVCEVFNGGAPMSPSIARKVLNLLQSAPPTPAEAPSDYQLSNREKDVLRCLVQGMSYKMIADACFISYETVRTHMKHIYEKLHVASMTEAVAKAINQKIV